MVVHWCGRRVMPARPCAGQVLGNAGPLSEGGWQGFLQDTRATRREQAQQARITCQTHVGKTADWIGWYQCFLWAFQHPTHTVLRTCIWSCSEEALRLASC